MTINLPRVSAASKRSALVCYGVRLAPVPAAASLSAGEQSQCQMPDVRQNWQTAGAFFCGRSGFCEWQCCLRLES